MVKRVPAHVGRKEEHFLNCLQEPKTLLKGPGECSKNFNASRLTNNRKHLRGRRPKPPLPCLIFDEPLDITIRCPRK